MGFVLAGVTAPISQVTETQKLGPNTSICHVVQMAKDILELLYSSPGF